jgi:hypothetical protein
MAHTTGGLAPLDKPRRGTPIDGIEPPDAVGISGSTIGWAIGVILGVFRKNLSEGVHITASIEPRVIPIDESVIRQPVFIEGRIFLGMRDVSTSQVCVIESHSIVDNERPDLIYAPTGHSRHLRRIWNHVTHVFVGSGRHRRRSAHRNIHPR